MRGLLNINYVISPSSHPAYAEVMNLSSMDFLGDDGDKLVGWGFMPKSVKALYPKRSSGK